MCEGHSSENKHTTRMKPNYKTIRYFPFPTPYQDINKAAV